MIHTLAKEKSTTSERSGKLAPTPDLRHGAESLRLGEPPDQARREREKERQGTVKGRKEDEGHLS